MHSAIEYLNRFLEICIESKNQDQIGQAYKRLAECESKNGNTGMAIQYLGKVLDIANTQFNRQAQADATLKLGLLFIQEGREHNIKRAADYLQNHFDLLRQDEPKNMQQIDAARVSIGIVQANQKIEAYKYMVLNNLQGLVDWKVRRDPKNLQ